MPYVEVTLNDTTYGYTVPNVGDDSTDSDIAPGSTLVGHTAFHQAHALCASAVAVA